MTAATLGCAAAPPHAPGLAQQVQAALADAARRTGVEATALTVASAERVTWLDGSLGCPDPEVMVTQALVPGYRIRIVAAGDTLDYHAGTRDAPRWCPPGRAVAPAAARPPISGKSTP